MALPESSPIEGKYEILQKLVEGGMGAVYKVRHRLLDEVRVIKVIRPQLEASSEVKERFLREARSAVRLRHPNIAELYDFTIDEAGVGFMVMEFIDGEDLRRLAKRRGRLSMALALEAAIQALRALGYLHLRGFVHRDISPDNLMVTKDVDGRPLIKLIDLGIAKPLEGEESLTMTGSFLGKFRYAAPEQFGGGGLGIDGRTDLYSLGVVLYELVTGRHPFPGETQHEVVGGHLFHPPIDFSESDAENRVPEALRRVVLRSLEKRADDRYQTAETFAAVLREAQREMGQEIPADEIPSKGATTGEPSEEGSKPGSTQERLDRQFGLGEATPIVTTLATQVLPPDLAPTQAIQEPQMTRIAPEAGRRRALGWVIGGVAVIAAVLAGVVLLGRSGVEAPLSPSVEAAASAESTAETPPSSTEPGNDLESDRRVEGLLTQARARFREGEDRATLDLVRQALAVAPENLEAARLQLELVHSARRGAERARSLAREAQAPGRAPATFSRAEETLMLAERQTAGGDPSAAAAGYWASADLFREATQQAEATLSHEARRAAEAAAVEARRAAEAAARRTAELDERARLAAAAAQQAAPPPPVEHREPPPVREQPAPAEPQQSVRLPSPPPPPEPVDESPAVLAVLDAYASAHQALDVEALQRVWPSLGGSQLAALRSSFAGAREIEVEITGCRVRAEDSDGRATCRVRQAYRPRHGSRQVDERQVTFQLRKIEGRWVIESL